MTDPTIHDIDKRVAVLEEARRSDDEIRKIAADAFGNLVSTVSGMEKTLNKMSVQVAKMVDLPEQVKALSDDKVGRDANIKLGRFALTSGLLTAIAGIVGGGIYAFWAYINRHILGG